MSAPSYGTSCLMCNLRRDPRCIACHKEGSGHACELHRTPCGKHAVPPKAAPAPAPQPEPQPETEKPQSGPRDHFPTTGGVPAELRNLKIWVGWDKIPDKDKPGKFKKPPRSPVTGKAIGPSVEWSEHFLTFEEAIKGARQHNLSGVGIVLLGGEGLIAIDFDNCVSDGSTHPEATTWLRWFGSFKERSVSGKGIHVIGKGHIARAVGVTPLPKAEGVTVEMYSTSRFLTVSGDRAGDTAGIGDIQVGVEKLLAELGLDPNAPNDAPEETTIEAAVNYLNKACEELAGLRDGRQGRATQTCYWLGRVLGGLDKQPELKDPRLTLELVKGRLTLALEKTGWPREKFEVIERQLRTGMSEPVTILTAEERRDKASVEAAARISLWLNNKDAPLPSLEEVLSDAALLGAKEFILYQRPMAQRLDLRAGELKKLVNLRRRASKKPEDQGDCITWGSGEISNATRAAEKILCTIPGKYLECAGRLVSPVEARHLPKAKKVERDNDSVVIAGATPESIQRDLDDRLKFVVKHQAADGTIYYSAIDPPYAICDHLFDRVKTQANSIPYPHLDMLVNTPVLLPDGTVHDAPGELREGVLFLAPRCEFPRVIVQPSRQDALDALKKFEPIFSGFPFVGADREGKPLPWHQTPSYGVVLAGCLTIAARSALPIAVPIIVIRAPQPRTGKTRVADASSLAITGCKPTKVTYSNEEEFNKMLLPIMMHQDRVVLIDNIAVPLRSTKLAPLITDNCLRDRILGKSEMVDLHNHSVIYATGNNITVTGDMAVRALQIGIDANMEHPETREFSFIPEDRARAHHPELVSAALTALRAYVVAGKPQNLRRSIWGGLEEWDRLISGCLVWLGYADPYVTRLDVLANDYEREAGDNLLQTWYEEFGEASVTLAGISDPTKRATNRTRDQLLDKDGKWSAHDIGWRMRRLRDRVQGGLKLVKAGDREWRVVRVGNQEQRDSSPELLF